MAGTLLETKFHVPRGPRTGVIRTRLIDRLDRGTEAALTLVSAPAGFGKTTLLAQWLATSATGHRAACWITLDHRDNDATLFWTYLITAVNRAANGVGAAALSMLQPPMPPIEVVLSSLLNDLAATDSDLVLVLDDYHLIDAPDIRDGMTFLLANIPPQLRLILSGRSDPALPLPRLRSRGELVEIRAADLRFTAAEAAEYLNAGMGLALAAPDIAALDDRTEGWIAALQLAALSIQGRDDVAAFIAGFAGDDRYIVDYLVEEVLNRQADDVRSFLLSTSILERLSGPLCDAVTGRDASKAMLEKLERRNLFLVPLDDRRRWYRYHQLFADVLQTHLLEEQPDLVSELHRRASEWYEENGDAFEAIRHALIAENHEHAADLIERAIPEIRKSRQEASLRRWLAALPDDVVRVRPVLNLGFAGALLASGEIEGVDARLRDAERWLVDSGGLRRAPSARSTAMLAADQEELRRVPAMIALYRAALALATGNLVDTVDNARRAIDLAGTDHLGRAAAAGLLGIASWAGGDLEAAHSAYADCSAGLLRAGHVADTLGCAIALADIRLTQGRLRDAERTFEQALRRAGADLDAVRGGSMLRGTADMHVGLAECHRERGDLAGATRHLLRSQELGEHLGLPQNRYRWQLAMARLRQAEGDLDAALVHLDEAERCYVGDYFPDVRPVAAWRVRVWIGQGRLADALGWAQARDLSPDDDLNYLREFEHITLARLLVAQSAADGMDRTIAGVAADLLERLLRVAQAGGRAGSVIEILLLQALLHQARGNAQAAMPPLFQALGLAEPEGYRRIFLDEGAPMSALLRTAARHRQPPASVHRLLATLTATAAGHPSAPNLVEPLSTRELDVLRLLGTDLDGPDIAGRLFISLNTVRTHTRNIYAKLGVNNRRAAVRRAAELSLLSRPQDD